MERMVESSLAPLRMIVPNRRDALSSSMMVISNGLVVSLYSLRMCAISSNDIGYDDMSDGWHGSKNPSDWLERCCSSLMMPCSESSLFPILLMIW